VGKVRIRNQKYYLVFMEHMEICFWSPICLHGMVLHWAGKQCYLFSNKFQTAEIHICKPNFSNTYIQNA